MAGRLGTCIAVVLLCSLPLAAAGSFGLATDEPVALEADVEARFPGGQARIDNPRVVAQAQLSGATGMLRVYSWSVARLGQPPADIVQRTGDVDVRDYALEDASMVIRYADDEQVVAIVAHAGELAVQAQMSEAGRAGRVPASTSARRIPIAPDDAVPDVRTQWEAGWPLAGRAVFPSGEVVGLPYVPGATLLAQGEISIKFHGGTIVVTDAPGVPAAIETGDAAQVGQDGLGLQRRTRAIFTGYVAGASIPLGDHWAVAGPEMTWAIDGQMALEDARGWVEMDGKRARIEGEPVDVIGTFDVLPIIDDALLRAGDTYEGAGELRSARLGATWWTAAAPASAPAGLGIFAFLAVHGVIARIASLFYTRLTRSDAIEHPTRSRILALVTAQPGIHLRELHRSTGGAWGPFVFHLGVLQKQGLLTILRDGRYRAVYGPTAPPTGSVIHHPLARRIYEAVPTEGSARITDLAAQVGASRPLVLYHIRKLSREGRLEIAGRGSERAAARAR